MKRRIFLRNASLAAAGVVGVSNIHATQAADSKGQLKKPMLTVAHITDVHIRPDENIPERFKKCLEAVKRHKVDFFLNGGDSIHDASYDNVQRTRVTEQWAVWDECMQSLKGYDVYSCIGNHDPWWSAPSKEDEMYGIPYTVKRLGIPHNYYSFTKKNWRFIILDGNYKGITLGEEQTEWLKKELEEVPQGNFVLLMSHYPILTVTGTWEGGQHKDHKELKQLFYKYKDKVRICLSGHQHLLDRAWYNGVDYFCNGAMSGFWWGKGNEKSAQPYYYQETPPGYAIINLYEDGRVENRYIAVNM